MFVLINDDYHSAVIGFGYFSSRILGLCLSFQGSKFACWQRMASLKVKLRKGNDLDNFIDRACNGYSHEC